MPRSDAANASSKRIEIASANERCAKPAAMGSPGTERRTSRSIQSMCSTFWASPGIAVR
jgi:hypothetical protein